jgi:hypothetical protein
MPKLTYQDLTISVGTFGGDFTVQIRTLNEKLTPVQLAACVYPIFDAQEKALVARKIGDYADESYLRP